MNRTIAPTRSGPTTSAQNRVTDHRINLTTHQLPSVLEGDLDELIEAVTSSYQAEQLKAAAPADA